jgi:hypothetical protein
MVAGGASVDYTYDGINWITSPSGTALFTACTAVAWNGSLWVAGGDSVSKGSPSGVIAYSSDGFIWTNSTSIFSSSCTKFAGGAQQLITRLTNITHPSRYDVTSRDQLL